MPTKRIMQQHPRPNRGVALVITIFLLVLLMAATVELTTLTATQSVVLVRRQRQWAHELACDGALLVMSEQLDSMHPQCPRINAELDASGRYRTEFAVGDLRVTCLLEDDAAKFHPRSFQRDDQAWQLERKLAFLASRHGLRGKIQLAPVVMTPQDPTSERYFWFDQLLNEVPPGESLRWSADTNSTRNVWSDVLTFWGDGRVDLRRVNEAVLEASLEDLQAGLARTMLARRPKDKGADFREAALSAVPAELHEEVKRRITFHSRRYALRIDTSCGADLRRWYVVAQIADGKAQILHRSQWTW